MSTFERGPPVSTALLPTWAGVAPKRVTAERSLSSPGTAFPSSEEADRSRTDFGATRLVRWAIIGPGAIARRFAADMRFSATGTVAAVASRAPERAGAFAVTLGPDVAHGSVDAVLARNDIDAVYVATPSASHASLACAALAAGKPVLVEKPVATSVADAERIAGAAADAKLLVMEAMWLRFTPGIVKAKAMIDAGAIGKLHSINASLGFSQLYRPERSIFDPHHGGALLDLGVYGLSLALFLAGPPLAASGQMRRFDNGAVASASLSLRHGRALSTLSCSLESEGSNEAVIAGSGGVIRIGRPFFCPPLLSLRCTAPIVAEANEDKDPSPLGRRPAIARLGAIRQMLSSVKQRRIPTLFSGTGLHYQADHFAECLALGRIDSPVMPMADSIDVLKIIEEVTASASD
ncbi:Gfo/Idh/MocA family protein [Consotaella salsifontis]|uniref:Predicted dehydrogenase n=1 Tax=Consotaella salsifontis TaxID=1365950 RepID=A0A1T4PW89_9HYPH|nr:Gfo/Idh/MocA family oxidoreductase [Consotaella salsifontis]SJZ95834.1 Predicted dehydrogenase [Consotaella salsifontis]